MTHNFPLPFHFVEILHDFTYAVMAKKPANYIHYAAKYFGKLANNQSLDGMSSSVDSASASLVSQSESNESLDSNQYANRRKSVTAERFNPEEMDSADFNLEVHEKSADQKQKLLKVCEKVSMFKSLSTTDVMNVIDAMYEIKVVPGQEIIKEGDFGDNFYIIESGVYEALITQYGVQKKIKTYDNEGNFGELALLYNAPRAASVVARSDGIIWAVTRQVFRTVVLVKAHKQREMYNNILENVPMLAPLSDFERANVADALVPKSCTAGELIIKEGDPGSQMYFIISGKVEIYKSNDKTKVVINTLGPGTYFGELALLSNQPRAATVEALENTVLAVLDVKSFERLMGPCIEVMKRNMIDYKKQVVNLFNG